MVISKAGRAVIGFAAVAGTVALLAFGVIGGTPAAYAAGAAALENDLAVPDDDPAAVEAGKSKVSQRCGLCHGGGARGGKGPCLVCGHFKRGGKSSNASNATVPATAANPMTARPALLMNISHSPFSIDDSQCRQNDHPVRPPACAPRPACGAGRAIDAHATDVATRTARSTERRNFPRSP